MRAVALILFTKELDGTQLEVEVGAVAGENREFLSILNIALVCSRKKCHKKVSFDRK